MIKNIVFDMGQVLVYFSPETFIRTIGINNEKDAKILLREVYQSVEWSCLDRGSLTGKEAAERICKRVPEHLWKAVDLLVNEWERPILPVKGMKELVQELKENGYSIYLLSNAGEHQPNYWNKIPGSEYFNGTMVSAFEHLVKPQPEIYQLLCSRFHLIPDECVFIDDATPNAEGAMFAGMHPIVFHDDVEELRTRLRELKVKI